jgi:hypothetical protein
LYDEEKEEVFVPPPVPRIAGVEFETVVLELGDDILPVEDVFQVSSYFKSGRQRDEALRQQLVKCLAL